MRKLSIVFIVFISCAAFHDTIQPPPDPVFYYGGIYGKIYNTRGNSPIDNVQVSILNTEFETLSDSSGNYFFYDLPSGSFTIRYLHSNFDTLSVENIQVDSKEIVNLDVQLKNIKQKSNAVHFDRFAYSGQKNHPVNTNYPGKEDQSNYSMSTMAPQYPSAASHNDNEEYPFYIDFLQRFSFLKNVYRTNFEDRLIIQIVDTMNHPVADKKFKLIDWNNSPVWESTTYANGENIIFKNAMIPTTPNYELKIEIDDGAEKRLFLLQESHDHIFTIKISNHKKPADSNLDLLFILDTTGSMKDEIQQLKDTIFSIYHRILKSYPELTMRIGFVLYRDKKDTYLIKSFQFTENIESIDELLNDIEAGGGGDTSEDIQTALEFAIHQMKWNSESIKLSFLLGDAPPHLDYNQEYTYLDASLDANRSGIKIFTIGASGLNIEGEYIFRQIAALTYSEFIFLTYGETGESDQSEAAKVSHHTGSNYDVRNLDDLIVNTVQKELSCQYISPQLANSIISPKSRATQISTRLENIWYQLIKQISHTYFKKPNAIVLPFDFHDSNLAELAQYLYDESVIHLIHDKNISLLEREKLSTLLAERNLVLSGFIDQMNISELPSILGADIVICGDIKRSGLDEVLFIRAIRCTDSEIIAAARIRM